MIHTIQLFPVGSIQQIKKITIILSRTCHSEFLERLAQVNVIVVVPLLEIKF